MERALQERAEAFEASDLLKTKFIQHVSYQLRAPLTNISGFGEMLSQEYFGALNEKQSEYVGSINESCQSLKAIVDDILDLAKVDAGAIDLNLAKVDLNDSIATSLEELSHILSRNNLAIDVQLETDSQSVIADPEGDIAGFFSQIGDKMMQQLGGV